MVRILCWLVFVTGLVLVSNTGSAQPVVVDTPWKQVSANSWTKRLGGVGGQATLTVTTGGGKLTYTVIRPCVSPDRTYTISWRTGSLIARGTGCGGLSLQEPIEPWLPWFQDVPLRGLSQSTF